MKTRTALTTAAFLFASLPLLGQQPPPYNRGGSAQQVPNSDQTAPTNPNPSYSPDQDRSAPPSRAGQAANPETAAAEAPETPMSPVSVELVGKLDSKTANVGDSIVAQTKQAVKTSDGTEIPKGSKLMGKVMDVQHSTGGDNSQLAVAFDRIELKGGQSVPVKSQIQSIGSASGSAASAGSPAMTAPPRSTAPTDPSASGSGSASGSSSPSSPTSRSSAPDASESAAAPASAGPVPGTLVTRTGNIGIRTTSVPGVLVANNMPGAQDPRMGQASSILLGAKQDIKLEGGTPMVVGISAANKGPQ